MTDKRANPLATKEQTKMLFDLLNEARGVGRVVRGVNEVTKFVNRGKAKLVLAAADAIPLEIVLHLPDLCEDKGIALMFVESRQALGRAIGLSRPAIAVAINGSQRKATIDDKIEQVLRRLELE